MRWWWLLGTVACGVPGRAMLDDGLHEDTDPPLTRDRPRDTDPPSDSDEDTAAPGSADDCGPWVSPPAAALGAPSVVFVGRAVTTDSWWAPSWHGCEVERHFDASGRFRCEVWRDVDGPGESTPVQGWLGAPSVVFDVHARVVPGRSTCRRTDDQVVTYGLDASSRRLRIMWAPYGTRSFHRFTSAAYRRHGAGFRFDYASGFMAP